MSHLEPEDLALAALGEPVTDDARAHLASCAQCDRELRSLSATVGAGRAAGPEALTAPPSSVWAAVSAELGLPEHVQPGGPRVMEASDAPVQVDEFSARRSRRRAGRTATGAPWLAAAAAAGVVVGGLGVGWWSGRTPTPAVIEAEEFRNTLGIGVTDAGDKVAGLLDRPHPAVAAALHEVDGQWRTVLPMKPAE